MQSQTFQKFLFPTAVVKIVYPEQEENGDVVNYIIV